MFYPLSSNEIVLLKNKANNKKKKFYWIVSIISILTFIISYFLFAQTIFPPTIVAAFTFIFITLSSLNLLMDIRDTKKELKTNINVNQIEKMNELSKQHPEIEQFKKEVLLLKREMLEYEYLMCLKIANSRNQKNKEAITSEIKKNFYNNENDETVILQPLKINLIIEKPTTNILQ